MNDEILSKIYGTLWVLVAFLSLLNLALPFHLPSLKKLVGCYYPFTEIQRIIHLKWWVLAHMLLRVPCQLNHGVILHKESIERHNKWAPKKGPLQIGKMKSFPI